MRELRRICVYAGASAGVRPAYSAAAADLGRLLADRGLGVVYGGGDIGLMGALADAALEAGGEVVGVIPKALLEREIGHQGLTELRVVGSMHERKLAMAEMSDAFIALPGGIGTVEELVEAMTWTQLGVHAKPCGLLDVEGYYAALLAFLDHAQHEGFLREEHRGLLLTSADPGDLLRGFAKWEPSALEHWIDRESA